MKELDIDQNLCSKGLYKKLATAKMRILNIHRLLPPSGLSSLNGCK